MCNRSPIFMYFGLQKLSLCYEVSSSGKHEINGLVTFENEVKKKIWKLKKKIIDHKNIKKITLLDKQILNDILK